MKLREVLVCADLVTPGTVKVGEIGMKWKNVNGVSENGIKWYRLIARMARMK